MRSCPLCRGLLDHVLEGLDVIARVQHGVEAVVDLILAGTDLVVEALDIEANLLQVLYHGVAHLTVLVIRRGGEVAALHTGLVAGVRGAVEVGFAIAVPPTLIGIHLVEAVLYVGAKAHGVKEVELGLSAKVAGIGNAGGLQVLFRLARDVARVAGERLKGKWVVDEELDVQGLGRAERIDMCGGWIRQQGHVGLIDGGESADRGAVESEAAFGIFYGELFCWDGKVVLGAWDVRKADIDELYVLVLNKLDDVLHCLERHVCLLVVDR